MPEIMWTAPAILTIVDLDGNRRIKHGLLGDLATDAADLSRTGNTVCIEVVDGVAYYGAAIQLLAHERKDRLSAAAAN